MKKQLLSLLSFIVLALLATGVSRGSEWLSTLQPVGSGEAAVSPVDIPPLCQETGKNCGDILDDAGQSVHCGDCSPPDTCGGSGIPNVCGCTPKTCAGHCGIFNPGCRRADLSCGGCPNPLDTCGGGGTANVCGCTPRACAGLNCGSINPGCGLPLLSCGTCSGTATCGTGGRANVCCTPRTCAGVNCGSIDPGCGLPPLNCGGPCCTPRSCRTNECGMTDLGCGIRRNCGGCPDDQICREGFCRRIGPDPDHQCPCGGHWPNACQICTESAQAPALCVERGKNCGLIDDGHGKKVDCGTCKDGNTCGGGGVPNVCGRPRKKK